MSVKLVKPTEKRVQAREKFAAPIKCRCGQEGSAFWEENALPNPRGPMPVLLDVSGGFYFRLRKKNVARTEIVCGLCERIVPD
jgi:hypothetical protein